MRWLAIGFLVVVSAVALIGLAVIFLTLIAVWLLSAVSVF